MNVFTGQQASEMYDKGTFPNKSIGVFELFTCWGYWINYNGIFDTDIADSEEEAFRRAKLNLL